MCTHTTQLWGERHTTGKMRFHLKGKEGRSPERVRRGGDIGNGSCWKKRRENSTDENENREKFKAYRSNEHNPEPVRPHSGGGAGRKALVAPHSGDVHDTTTVCVCMCVMGGRA